MKLGRLVPVKKALLFERSYPAEPSRVWAAWTEPEHLRMWWGPENTFIDECEVDLRVGGQVRIVMVAGDAMGKYRGTRWPMVGTITHLDAPTRLTMDARSWTEGEEEATMILHTIDLLLAEGPTGSTGVTLNIAISSVGPEARLAAFGMKWGYKQQLDKLQAVLAGNPS